MKVCTGKNRAERAARHDKGWAGRLEKTERLCRDTRAASEPRCSEDKINISRGVHTTDLMDETMRRKKWSNFQGGKNPYLVGQEED